MSIGSWILARLWHLPAPCTPDIIEHHDMYVSMSDGVELLTDRYYPRGGETLPVVLIRSPYGRGYQFRDLALILAERGFQVLLQSCRGTWGSGGSLRPILQEEQDGVCTIDWLGRQPWFCGKLALLGTSYLGNAAWAAVHAAPGKIAAMVLHATLSEARAETYAFEGFTLEGCLAWSLQLTKPQLTGTVPLLLRGWLTRMPDKPPNLPAFQVLPLRDADKSAIGRHVSWWQDWVDHAEPDDPFWKPLNFTAGVAEAPPTAMISGWHDIFLPWQIKDFAAMQAAFRPASLTVGPWVHAAIEAWGEGVRQALLLFGAELLDQPAPPRAPVRLYVLGAEEWRDYDSWPPPGFSPVAFYFCAGGGLSTGPPPPSQPGRYVYDPANPTPAVHGPRLNGIRPTGDMAELESRSDVLLFTAEPLAASVEVIGPVSAELFFRSSLEHTDFFLVLCDVAPNGVSTNVCDGYTRVRPDRPIHLSDGTCQVHIEFWPTAYRYRPGHRMRIIVASGAHPRYARNLGSGEPLADAVTFHVAHQQIFHDPQHASRVLLPICISA
jgi:putative CocE/NonD family hydrolase